VMGAEFGIEVAENSDPEGFDHMGHSKLAVRTRRCAVSYCLRRTKKDIRFRD